MFHDITVAAVCGGAMLGMYEANKLMGREGGRESSGMTAQACSCRWVGELVETSPPHLQP